MQTFNVKDGVEIVCEWHKTRNAFKHTATLLRNGREVDSTKICYSNRTWERYEFESVLSKMLDRMGDELTADEKRAVLERGRVEDPAMARLGSIAAVAALGSIFHAGDQSAANDWKARMLKAGLGDAMIMPEDWGTLSEDEKQARLDGAIKLLQ